MSNKIPVDWSIRDLDHQILIQPQFPLSAGVSVSVGGVLADQPRFGFQDSIVQWVQGTARVFTFKTMLFSRDRTEDITGLLGQFEDLAIKDNSLGRPPICLFAYGRTISETVLVESIDPLITDIMDNGSPRQATLNFTLRKYTPFSQSQIDPTKPTKESFFLVASRAEQSWEAIARTHYGDPMLGDRLRKRHPGSPFAPAIGETVSIPARSIILSEVVEPSSHIFDFSSAAAIDAFEVILEDRNARRLVIAE